MSAHTPGPWTVHERHAPYSVWGFGTAENTQVAACRVLLDDGTWDRYFAGTSDECVANARLIAAAPELLAALHQAVAIIRVFVDVDDTRWSHLRDAAELQAIEAAIAKAEGAR
jgi:hypothetical protein